LLPKYESFIFVPFAPVPVAAGVDWVC